jgi:hypothetical protein
MAIPVTCSQCGRQYNVKDDAAGKKFKCKDCGAVVDVPQAASDNAPQDEFGDLDSPYADDDFGAAPPVSTRPKRRKSSARSGAAAERTFAPALCLYIVCGLSLAYWIFNLVANLMGIVPLGGLGNAQQQMAQEVGRVIGLAITGVLFVKDLFIIYAARKMQVLQSYGVALTGAILSVIPCCGSPCFVLGIPFGIWALVVLNDESVKSAFR